MKIIVYILALLTFCNTAYAQQYNKNLFERDLPAQLNNLVLRGPAVDGPITELPDGTKTASSYAQQPVSFTKYGYDFYSSQANNNSLQRVRFRGGVSKISTKASAGVELILSW